MSKGVNVDTAMVVPGSVTYFGFPPGGNVTVGFKINTWDHTQNMNVEWHTKNSVLMYCHHEFGEPFFPHLEIT